jgi:hypothetical protein
VADVTDGRDETVCLSVCVNRFKISAWERLTGGPKNEKRYFVTTRDFGLSRNTACLASLQIPGSEVKATEMIKISKTMV